MSGLPAPALEAGGRARPAASQGSRTTGMTKRASHLSNRRPVFMRCIWKNRLRMGTSAPDTFWRFERPVAPATLQLSR
jgi:hypothetical protein